MNQSSNQERYKRNVTFLIIILLISALTFQLVHLQVVKYQMYYRQADNNRIRLIPIEAPRGVIYDRNYRILAGNENSYTISVTPYRIENRTSSVKKICNLFDLDTNKVLKQSQARYSFKPIPLIRNADYSKISILEEHRESLPGIIIQRGLIRYYPYREAACHAIGYLNEVSEDKLKEMESQGYSYGDLIGISGIEKVYENYLRGTDGYKYIEVNAFEKEMGDIYPEKTQKPIPGKDVRISLDIELQRYTEQLLNPFDAGSLVAIHIPSGEVITLANRPGFDLNLFSGVISTEEWKKIQENEMHPMFNRAISSQYAPGSVYKMVTAAAAIEILGVNSLTTMPLPCTGKMAVGNRDFRCWKASGHGNVNLIQAIAQSCDVYFYQIGMKIGVNKLHDYSLKFGFSDYTGIDLPGEKKGLIPYEEYYTKKLGWHHVPGGIVVNLSIGQGEIMTTPLQIAFMMGLIANDGICNRPHLLINWKEPGTNKNMFYHGETMNLDLKPYTIKLLQKGLKAAVHGHLATGHRSATTPGIEVAGKTGSAETYYSKKKTKETHSWFAGYAPAKNPRIAFACILEHSGHGGSIAAPVVGDFLSFYFDTLGYRYVEE